MKYIFNGEVRSESSESRVIQGKAISFNTESNDLGFVEIIRSGAITQDVIDNSNIIFTYNHDRSDILARSNNGNGTLGITLQDDGVYFRFEAPHTRLGDDMLELIQRGDVNKCSFAFTIPNEEGSIKWSKRDGVMLREVFKIDKLYDLSAVIDPAYNDTYVSARNEEKMKAEIELSKDEEVSEDVESNQVVEQIDIPVCDNTDEETTEEEVKEAVEITEERNNDKKEHKQIMEKRFSFVGAINAIVNNRKLDAVDAAVINAGTEEMRNSGLAFAGQIQLPVSALEERANITVASEGEDLVPTDVYDVMKPLRAKNVLVQAGAKFLTGLKGNVKIPVMGASNVAWANETGAASDGAGAFTSATLSPKRLTAYINISKELLNCSGNNDVEALIREDLVNAINSKLEQTILGTASGNTTQPAGMFYGNTTTKSVTTMAKIAEVEAGVEEHNVIGETKWIVSPKFKATLRGAGKTGNGSNPIYMNGEIDGKEALSTSNVGANTAIYGDFSNLAIGQFGAIDIVLDPYTEAKNGMIVLVVNAYFDAAVLRGDAFGYATTQAS